MKYFQRELKVCEGCGGLWVRTGAEAGVYCRHCSAILADLPGRRKRSPGRPAKAASADAAVGRLHLVQATGDSAGQRGRCRRVTPEELKAAEQRAQQAAAQRRARMSLCPREAVSRTAGYNAAVSGSAETGAAAAVPVQHATTFEISSVVSPVPMMYAVAGGAR